MKKYFVLVGLVAAAWGLAGLAEAQDPQFGLTMDAPASIVLLPGATAQYTATVKLTTTGLAETDPGAQGWSLSVAKTGGGAIVGATTSATVDALFAGGFKSVEQTTGTGNEGVVCAVVLAFKKPVTLPPSGTSEILKILVEGTVPEPVDVAGEPACEPLVSTLAFVNGRKGSGEPVDNKITYKGETVIPTLGAPASTSICPVIVKPLTFRVDFRSPPATTADADAAPTAAYVAEIVPPGPTEVPVTAGLVLDSKLGLGVTAGAQGWSVSVESEPCFNISACTHGGTDAAGADQGGFSSTEVIDNVQPPTDIGIDKFPDGYSPQNGGKQGCVSAIVLHFKKPITLPPNAKSFVLQMDGVVDASAVTGEGTESAPCGIKVLGPDEPGLIGAGEPVQTAVTVAGETKKPAACGATLKFVPATAAQFLRGNANAQGKVDIADAIWIVNELFKGGPVTICPDAADANDNGIAPEVSDVVYLISFQFGQPNPSVAPPAPYPACGVDPTDDTLECEGTPVYCK